MARHGHVSALGAGDHLIDRAKLAGRKFGLQSGDEGVYKLVLLRRDSSEHTGRLRPVRQGWSPVRVSEAC
eukprot:scaffold12565_cov35-Tisochrysis_lutea.AAC.1